MSEALYVVAMPKSGSTYLCRILGDALNSPIDGVVDAVPLAKEGQDRKGNYTVFQTHLSAEHCGKNYELTHDRFQFNIDVWTTQKVIHLVRDPRAIAVSAMYYWGIQSLDYTLDIMQNGDFPIQFNYINFVTGWLDTKAYTLKYEDLLDNPAYALTLLFATFGIPYSKRRLYRAIQRQSFDIRRRELEASKDKYPYSSGIQTKNLRKGTKDDWRLYFTDALKHKALNYFGDIMQRLNYDTAPDSWDAARTILEIIFPNQPEPSIRKAQVLYELSRQAKEGALVELGVAQGRGLIAMALGAKDGYGLKVYGVDDYKDHLDWANNQYDLTNIPILLGSANKADVEIEVLTEDAVQAGQVWTKPVALWCWDISTTAEDLWNAWLVWYPHIQPNGIAFIRDLYDKRFDSDRVKEHALEHGFSVEMEEPGILLLRKQDA